MNQIHYEDPIESFNYEAEIDLAMQYMVDSPRMYPQYYIEDVIGRSKHVFQLHAIARKG